MILADLPTPSASFMGNWIFAAFAFCSIVAVVIAILSYFATRREVDELKISNIKAWEKMERDRVEANDRVADASKEIAALTSTVAALTGAVNLLNFKIDQMK